MGQRKTVPTAVEAYTIIIELFTNVDLYIQLTLIETFFYDLEPGIV